MQAGRFLYGQVSERLKERHWKCRVRLVRTVGSNPTLSAFEVKRSVGRPSGIGRLGQTVDRVLADTFASQVR